jgi:hypothetical protein
MGTHCPAGLGEGGWRPAARVHAGEGTEEVDCRQALRLTTSGARRGCTVKPWLRGGWLARSLGTMDGTQRMLQVLFLLRKHGGLMRGA